MNFSEQSVLCTRLLSFVSVELIAATSSDDCPLGHIPPVCLSYRLIVLLIGEQYRRDESVCCENKRHYCSVLSTAL